MRNSSADPSPGSRILGVGAYRPARRVTNAEVAGPIDSSDEWIRRRSGIVSRRFAGEGETVVAMAVEASVKALAQAGVAPEQVDVVVLATMSHLNPVPAAAPQVSHLIGTRGAAAFDLDAACSGFCHALAVADALIRTGGARHVVVAGSERMTDLLDPADRGTAFIFGDGAGAVVLGPAAQPGIGPVVWGSDGSQHELITLDRPWDDVRSRPAPWPTMRMAGPEVFRWATGTVPELCRRALTVAGVDVTELAAFVPHQANGRIVDATAKALGLSEHTVVARHVEELGNTSAASIPLALDDLLARGLVPSGGYALLAGFGAGLTQAALVAQLP
ncbi:ketoacyl-ACP synthase III [Actinoplanes sp. TBRC 11911]|uniref:beta-ketoacyl-ACP synthase III n=1 Tax=Actinoplanes sp. TBRC 11911 TaxID=2729386 RepID=UPI00145CE711|nr:beta-ketoacyl-ACP synthase III [Actinoplanes sp. TBRC 11911]NMO53355.1 ketoacyl-ACP synthase III [Actinoplanes sp. TBRC 11911]